VVRITKGQAPPPAEAVLVTPQPRTPKDGVLFKFPPVKGQTGLGPVTLTWSTVAGAKGYEVEVLAADGSPLRNTVSAAQWKLPMLPAGRYRWTVRALTDSQKSNASVERSFELTEDRVALQVGKTDWK
jgi:hypothetical protein